MLPELPGGADGGLLALLLTLTAANLLTIAVARRLATKRRRAVQRRRRSADASADGRAASDATSDDPMVPDRATGANETVPCPECSTENEAGYRFCRQCIAELPGSVYARPSSTDASRRPLF